ncbi:MAG TPA: hypothetical protein VLE72_02305 [Candidatus Saccharimonadales bacterium]|nr:hypothetical protein [Candidatus Saccharimonadales bacterium]
MPENVLSASVWWVRGSTPSSETGTQYAGHFRAGQLTIQPNSIIQLSDDGKLLFELKAREITISPNSVTSGFTFRTPSDNFVVSLTDPKYLGGGGKNAGGFGFEYRKWKKALKRTGVKYKWWNFNLN